MKKVSLIVSHFYPENTAATNRLVSLANSLAKNYDLKVLTLTERGERKKEKKIFFNNYPVYYVNQKNYDNLNFFLKFFYELFYTTKLCFFSRNHKADIIITSSPYMLLIYSVMFFCKPSQKVLDLRDLTWTYLPEKSFLQRIVKFFFSNLSKFVIPKYNIVTVTNQKEYNWVNQNTKAKSIYIVPNGIERSKFEILSNLNLKKTSPPDERKTISYLGNLGMGQNILSLVKIISNFNNLELQIIGSGNQLNEIKDYVEIEKLDNIKIIGKVDWHQLPIYYLRTDYLFAQLDKTYQTAVPSKLYEYISTGLPVIFSGEGMAQEFLSYFENTYNVKNEKELTNLLKEMNHIKKNKISYNNIKKIEENYLREDQNEKFISILESNLSFTEK